MDDFEKLINASDLIEWIMETYPDWCVGDVRSIVDHVMDLPSAEPERKRGKWIPKDDRRYHCSSCDGVAPKGYRWDYCPSCGADMRGEEQDATD